MTSRFGFAALLSGRQAGFRHVAACATPRAGCVVLLVETTTHGQQHALQFPDAAAQGHGNTGGTPTPRQRQSSRRSRPYCRHKPGSTSPRF